MIASYQAVPYEKLEVFRQWLGIGDKEITRLMSLGHFFAGKKKDFAYFFSGFFMEIPEARFIIEHEERPGFLFEAWEEWFESLFTQGLSAEFQAYLWRIGLRHVEVNLDQRFSNLGFSVLRRFCRNMISQEFGDEAPELLSLVDNVIDFCILVETHAYIEGTTRCDIEIMKGVADRMRNPLTVIGGNINRLIKSANEKDPNYPVYEFISSQSMKCERMLKDIRVFMDIYEREPVFQKISLSELLGNVIGHLLSRGRYPQTQLEMSIEEEASFIMADRIDMEVLFENIIENGLEALNSENPLLKISSTLKEAPSHSLIVQIFNTGRPLRSEDIDKLFSPFYSTKPLGTGFGLGIARQAVRKNRGRIRIESVRDEGTEVILSLPLYEPA